MVTRRSRNSYIFAPRNVTLQPIAKLSRTLNDAIDLRARVTSGFWPVIFARSPTALSMIFLSATASPTPMLTVILVIFGTSMTFFSSRLFWSPGTIVSRYIFLSLADIDHRALGAGHWALVRKRSSLRPAPRAQSPPFIQHL